MRTLTTVQGLPSNSVYSVWVEGDRIFAGTLGGLAELSSGRVVRVFKDSNSTLKNNWVTVVCGAGGRLFIGTYGGGVFELMPSGELRSFAPETGAAFVNANAMWGDSQRLYVGTLDGALVFDLRSQKWARLRDELPSQTVLSVAGREGQVYFGTTSGLARFDASFFNSAEFKSAD
jgi:ligand-binding sensor domain-containing protein